MILRVDFSEIEQSFDVLLAEADRSFDIDFQNLVLVPEKPDFDYYAGEYEVIPKTTAQVLGTKQKIMEKDMVIEEIPYFETSNNSGGNTVYIGDLKEITIQ